MIIDAASRSVANLVRRETRSVVLKVLAVTILVLAALWLLLQQAFNAWIWPFVEDGLGRLPDWAAWAALPLSILSSLGLAVALIFLMAPVTTLVAGLFLDDVAESVEAHDYPADPVGRALPLVPAMISAAKFSAVVLGMNALALVFYLIPGVNVVVFFLVNGYLIGREYFEFAAMRHMSPEDARALRARHSGTVLAAGALAALLMAVPFANLLTPIFAAGMMVHIVKTILRRQAIARA